METVSNPNVPPAAPRPPAAAPREIELKLSASPEALAAIRDCDLVARHARNRGSVRRLHAVYYDTPDRLLDAAGIALRVRRSGSRHVMTVKRPAGDDPLARLEWEVPVPDERPDLFLLPLAEIGEPLADLDPVTLVPAFVTRIRRRLLRLDVEGSEIEIALDDGEVEAGGTSEPVHEVELELVKGEPAQLYVFGRALLEVAPLTLETETKSGRGHRLAYGAGLAARKARPVALSPQDNVDAALAAILANGHAHLVGNISPVLRSGRPEAVHQMRVALRRLRSALTLFRRELGSPALGALTGEARSLGHALGPARNWDVFATQTLPAIVQDGLGDVGLAALDEAATPHRAASYERVHAALASPEVNGFFLSLGAAIERRVWRSDMSGEALGTLGEPIGSFAARILSRSHRKVLRRGRHFGRLDPEARHELRLALKKLRYMVEFFLPLHAGRPAARRYLARMQALQEALGLANDAATTQELLATLRAESEAPGLQFAAGAVLGWQRRAAVDGSRRLRKSWRKFEAATPFWT